MLWQKNCRLFSCPHFPIIAGLASILHRHMQGYPVRASARQDHACASETMLSIWSWQHSGSPLLLHCVCSCSHHADQKYCFPERSLFCVSVTKIHLCKYADFIIIYQPTRQWELRSLEALNLGSLLDGCRSMGEQQVRKAPL